MPRRAPRYWTLPWVEAWRHGESTTAPSTREYQAGGLLTILNWAASIGLVLGVLGVIIVGIGMVIQLQRGEGAQAIGKLGWVLMGCIIITGAAGIVRAFV